MVYWAPVGAYAALIYYLSDQVRPPGPTLWLIELIGDKALHGIEYSVLGWLCFRAFCRGAGAWAAGHAMWLAIVASTLYGITDEIHQAFVPMREPSGWDVVADSIGATLSVAIRRWIGP